MKKKNVIWFIVAVIVLVLAIVLYRGWAIDASDGSLGEDSRDSLLAEPTKVGGLTYLVPSGRVFDSGADLPAIEASFTNIATADEYLSDEVTGIDVEVNGRHYFYSYQILNWHEVAYQTIEDKVLNVTYCTLCHAPAVYLADEAFSHAGKIYNNNELIMDASTGSYWNQMTGLAIVGERAGERLDKYPFETMSWDEWKDRYPQGSVLSSDTGHERDYGRHPFENYDTAKITYFPMSTIDDRVSAKWLVDGYEEGDISVAFSRTIMKGTWVLHFEVDGQKRVAFYNTKRGQTKVFESGDREFTYDQEQNVFVDQDGGTWSAHGVALSGSAEGTGLVSRETQEAFHMCWFANHTDTSVAFIDLNEEPSADVNEAE